MVSRLCGVLLACLLPWAALAEPLALPGRPVAPEPIEGQCPRAWTLEAGKPAPTALLEVKSGKVIAKCSAVAVPSSKAAHLLLVANAYDESRQIHGLHVRRLSEDADYWKQRALTAEAPIPWHLRPGSQQAIGGAKVLVAVGLAVLALRATTEVGR